MILADPSVVLAEGHEVLGSIERHGLHGKSMGYVDAHLLASVALTAGAKLWTRDQRSRVLARSLGCAFKGSPAH